MLFNSLHFLIFLPVVVIGHYALPQRVRPWWLLATSYYFYGSWNTAYLGLIATVTVVNFLAARAIAGSDSRHVRIAWLVAGVGTSLGFLFAFKYLDFAATAVSDVAAWLGHGRPFEPLHLVLPVGISFFTFQTLSYTIDVYRRQATVEPSLARFALFVAFWPQLVAGPIERSQHLLPQLRGPLTAAPADWRRGCARLLLGFFKKVVIADRLAPFVDLAFADPTSQSAGMLLLASYAFAFQIYCDFSGYSDIAVGCGRFLGVDLSENFRRPYFARSIRDFWQRWHVTLSTWFRDYVYIPLGGNRSTRARWAGNILATFVVSGLWHGANYTFLAWGALHGGLYLIGHRLGPQFHRIARAAGMLDRPRLWTSLQRLWTFHLVTLAWIFFRAESIGQAGVVIRRIATGAWQWSAVSLPHGTLDMAVGLVAVATLLGAEYLLRDEPLETAVTRWSATTWWTAATVALLTITWFGRFTQNEFIYFQF